ncbi:ATP-binding cassette domain-containing protein [Hwanghaeella sp. LZ110]|uniref:ATP-binding cassette domain-containing protein n=1 Tax=Hwanghaeella sp. LZ110 TaxID=3402810 RepID=UPI003B6759AF
MLKQEGKQPEGEAQGSVCFDLNGASFRIEDRVLVEPTTLSLTGGRVYGLIGHNGSGKTTLLRLLARQQTVSSGRIDFQGLPLDNWSHRCYARKVAYLPQTPPAAIGMTVQELVALGRYPWHGALGRFTNKDRQKVEEAMVATGVGAFATRLVDSLSGGERQRAWLAMLVAQNPDCLLLDEPTSALDLAHQIQVLDLVRRLARNGPTVVVVLHDVNMAARFCDEVLAMRGGKLIHGGPPADVVTEASLKAIYNLPMVVLPHPETGDPMAFPR